MKDTFVGECRAIELPRKSTLICVSSIVSLRWHAVSSWTWDAQDETCGICRMAFDGCCPDCKLPGDDCPLSKPVYLSLIVF
ncbi:hypothetical protein KY289_002945 [Solanum tuberosum]|nr:hypothetical protein KY289_002945 [Solanum tuberosum]